MSRFTAITLDLSRFPAPLAIRDMSFDKIFAERLARLQALFDEADIPFSVTMLQTDPAVVQQRVDAFRETAVFAWINDAVKSVMVAFATSTDLDNLALTAATNLPLNWRDSLLRRIIRPATENTPAELESDAEFRRRILLAPEAYSTGGTLGSWMFHALWADPRVLNVDVWTPAPGEVILAIQSREGDGTAAEDLIEVVRAHVTRSDIKPLTDMVSVRSVVNIPYSVSIDAYILPGPDPIAVKQAIEAAVQKVAADRRTPSRDMPRSALIGAAQLDIVDKIILTNPPADIARGYGEVAAIGTTDVTVHSHDG